MKDTALLEQELQKSQIEGNFSPALICEIEIAQPLIAIAARSARGGQQYTHAQCLVRLHTQPLGLLDLPLAPSGASVEAIAECIWQTLGNQINEHLHADGLPEVTCLDVMGLAISETPACLQERARFLQQAPFVSVVLSTRDRPDRLARCLPTLFAQQYPDYEVIVVDNAPSTSATADFLQQTYAAESRLRYVREDCPGLSSARNRGIVEARGEIIAFTDDDVVVDAHWLAGLVSGFGLLDQVACVTGLVLPLELETPAQLLFEAYGGFAHGFARRIFDLREHRWNKPAYPYIVGACGAGASMAFTASFLRKEGGFDPALGAGMPTQGGEDLASFFRVIIRGQRLVYEPAALVYHQHRSDYAALQKQLYGYGVGFTAYLAKIMLDAPWLLFDCLNKCIRSVFFLLRHGSARPEEAPKVMLFPPELKRLERQGQLRGPLAYVRGRWTSGWRRTGIALAEKRANTGRARERMTAEEPLHNLSVKG